MIEVNSITADKTYSCDSTISDVTFCSENETNYKRTIFTLLYFAKAQNCKCLILICIHSFFSLSI